MRIIYILFGLMMYTGLAFAAASDSTVDEFFQKTSTFTATDGKTLYAENCAGCHMPEGQGAKGAGMYPPLAKNNLVENPNYTGYIILHGLRGMPSFDPDLTDEQVVAVANHISENLGNKGTDKVTVSDIKSIRPENPVAYIDW